MEIEKYLSKMEEVLKDVNSVRFTVDKAELYSMYFLVKSLNRIASTLENMHSDNLRQRQIKNKV